MPIGVLRTNLLGSGGDLVVARCTKSDTELLQLGIPPWDPRGVTTPVLPSSHLNWFSFYRGTNFHLSNFFLLPFPQEPALAKPGHLLLSLFYFCRFRENFVK